jgi:hypothetical protein
MEVRLVTRKVRAVYLLERDVLADVLIEGSMTIQRMVRHDTEEV